MNKSIALSRVCKLSWVLSVALLGGGCAESPEAPADGDQAVGETKDAFSSYGVWAYGLAGADTSIRTVSAATNTCFLTGISGVFDVGAFNAGVSVSIGSDGYWWLDVTAASADDILYGAVICIPTATNRTAVMGWNGAPWAAGHLGAATTNRVCGMTAVWTPANGWQSNSDKVHVFNDGSDWFIGGTGNAAGAAVCVDTPSAWYPWERIAPNPGTDAFNLLSGTDTGPGGRQCFLQGLGGRFQNNSSFTDGVFITYSPGTTFWSMTTTNGKTGWAACVQ